MVRDRIERWRTAPEDLREMGEQKAQDAGSGNMEVVSQGSEGEDKIQRVRRCLGC